MKVGSLAQRWCPPCTGAVAGDAAASVAVVAGVVLAVAAVGPMEGKSPTVSDEPSGNAVAEFKYELAGQDRYPAREGVDAGERHRVRAANGDALRAARFTDVAGDLQIARGGVECLAAREHQRRVDRLCVCSCRS